MTMGNSLILKRFWILCLTIIPAFLSSGAQVRVGDYVCDVEFLTPTIAHITKIKEGHPISHKSLVVTLGPEEGLKTRKRDSETSVEISSDRLTASINKGNGLITFSANGQILLREQAFSLEERTEGNDSSAFISRQVFTLDEGEAIYGLGILQDGKMSRRGTHRYMIQSNTEDFQNVIQSVKGWCLYWDNYSPTHFDDDETGMAFCSDVADGIDYYLMFGEDVEGCVAEIRKLTGDVPMFPLWTYGFWQSKERYKSFAELTNVVETYRKLGIPIDGIVQDWQYWGSHYLWNAMEFLAEGFQKPKQAIDYVHSLGSHIMITVWSSFGPHTKGYRQMEEKGHLLGFNTWPLSGVSAGWPPRMDYPSGVRCYDAFSSEARDIYWNNLKNLFDLGIDAWWMDSTEPDNFDFSDDDFERIVGDDRSTMRRMRNAYPLAAVRGVYEHQRALSSEKRVFIMTRSGFAGQQRYAAGVWSGDVKSTWEALRAQVAAGLNFTLTGNPNFNSDIGGFHASGYNGKWDDGTGKDNPLFRELYARWMQYALFCPVFRSHGTEVAREIYLYGNEGEPLYDALLSTIKLRYRLIPYLYSMAYKVTVSRQSYMLPLVAFFRNDPKTWDEGSEFMFGQSILAAPILEAQYTSEEQMSLEKLRESGKTDIDFGEEKLTSKYLPKGTDWYDFWTGKKYSGGQTVNLTTTIKSIPMFVREGSIIPLGPQMQFTSEKPLDSLEIRIYPGADASLTLYEDEGDNYNYEKGIFATILLTWNDKSQCLTIGKRQGSYPGMPETRLFRITMPNGKQRTIEYKGEKTKVNLS